MPPVPGHCTASSCGFPPSLPHPGGCAGSLFPSPMGKHTCSHTLPPMHIRSQTLTHALLCTILIRSLMFRHAPMLTHTQSFPPSLPTGSESHHGHPLSLDSPQHLQPTRSGLWECFCCVLHLTQPVSLTIWSSSRLASKHQSSQVSKQSLSFSRAFFIVLCCV